MHHLRGGGGPLGQDLEGLFGHWPIMDDWFSTVGMATLGSQVADDVPFLPSELPRSFYGSYGSVYQSGRGGYYIGFSDPALSTGLKWIGERV